MEVKQWRAEAIRIGQAKIEMNFDTESYLVFLIVLKLCHKVRQLKLEPTLRKKNRKNSEKSSYNEVEQNL